MDKQGIHKLAGLARIRVSEAEEEKLADDLTQILHYVDTLKEVGANVSDTPELPPLYNVMRKDEDPHESGVYSKEIIDEMPETEDDYLKVKKIL